MAKPILLTDFQDDVISESMNGKRRYKMENNADGTVSLEDVTEYEQVGNSYGAGQINATNEAVNQSFDKNKLIKDLDAINALTEEGYAPDALTVKELSSSLGRDGETGNGIMTVHEKLDYLIENGIKGDYELAYIGNQVTTDGQNINYTFQKDYKKVYMILFGGRTSATPSVDSMTFSDGTTPVLDYNEVSASNDYRVRIYITHTETEVAKGTSVNYKITHNTWYFSTLIIFGKE